MARYIDADKAKQEFNIGFGGVSHAVIANQIIDSIPTADVAEVKHGEWVECEYDYDDYEHHRCSSCNVVAYFSYKTEPMYDENYDGDMEFVCETDVGILENLTNYCPNCGAKMDGR